MSTVKLFYCILIASSIHAQPLRMVSEFRRVGANNQIIAQDSVGEPREIISPAVLRGMHVSYRIVVATPPGMHYWMYVGANPEELIDYAIYREHATAGVPNSLEKVATPVGGTVIAPGVADTYWLDLYIPPTTPARRIRFEAQLNFDNRWVIYPLEMRVMEGTIADALPEDGTLALPKTFANTADASRAAFQSVICEGISTGSKDPTPTTSAASMTMPSQAAFLARNAVQDLALIRTAKTRGGEEPVLAGLEKALGATPLAAFCVPASKRKPYNPEIILRARDFLIRSSTGPAE
jgi:hypothetical protein